MNCTRVAQAGLVAAQQLTHNACTPYSGNSRAKPGTGAQQVWNGGLNSDLWQRAYAARMFILRLAEAEEEEEEGEGRTAAGGHAVAAAGHACALPAGEVSGVARADVEVELVGVAARLVLAAACGQRACQRLRRQQQRRCCYGVDHPGTLSRSSAQSHPIFHGSVAAGG